MPLHEQYTLFGFDRFLLLKKGYCWQGAYLESSDKVKKAIPRWWFYFNRWYLKRGVYNWTVLHLLFDSNEMPKKVDRKQDIDFGQ